jgi:sugar lactone lactonase YvrE
MSLQNGRYAAARPPGLAEGWSLERLTPVSRLFGANGLRTGPDGRIYVAQVTGSQISALDPGTSQLEPISPLGGEIIAPDDVAFDPRGNLYATEVMDGRVSVLGADGRPRVLRDDVPSANGITFHKGRLFIDECRLSGRLLELDLGGGAPRVLLENVPLPNALEAGPDGLLYFPVMGANEIWRIDPEGGAAERVVGDLGIPDAVKFDRKGYIISTQVQTGEVLRIDPRNGNRSVLAIVAPGLDNLTFVGDRLFVSNFDGQITEILGGGESRTLLPSGLNWPLDLAIGDDGQLYVADGTNFYVLPPGGRLQSIGMLFSPGYPGFLRGVAPLDCGGFAVTTAGGQVALYRPADKESQVLADGLDQLYGVSVAPGGAIVVAELGAGRVLSVQWGEVQALAAGLREPLGVAIGPDGACLVSETGAGRVVQS